MARKAGKTSSRSRHRAASRAANEPVVVDDSPVDDEAPVVEIEEFHPVDSHEAATLDPEYKGEQPADQAGKASSATGDGGALVPLDPLGRYLAEIRRFPLLTRKEESEIAKRYHQHHDREDAFRLVTANL